MFQRLHELLSHKQGRFTCIAAGGGRPASPKHIAKIDHVVSSGLDAKALAEIESQVGELPELLEFYRQFGSVRLFRDSVTCDGIGRASAYYMASPEGWADLKDRVEDWLYSIDEEEEWLPEWIKRYVVVGDIPNSGNYFLVPLIGSDRGKVFEFEHDGLEFIERGGSFAEFIEYLADTSAKRLSGIGGHTRYSDGTTEYQWMPESYEHGAKNA